MTINLDKMSKEEKKDIKVLVTGASGYIALHCVQYLLNTGYSVIGTIEPLRRLDGASDRLELVKADLIKDIEIWPSVIKGCKYILHVASPWPVVADESTISVAVNGTLTVLKAATQCGGIRKIVLTSSCAAINDGHKNDEKVFDETCWSNLEEENEKTSKKKIKPIDNYAKSKTLAEKAAWEYWKSLNKNDRYDLTVLNPTFVTGPVLSNVEHGSAMIIGRMINFRTFLACPKACLGIVDVRDVAKAHVLAIEDNARISNGERLLITHSRPVWFAEIVKWISEEFKSQGYFPTPLVVPDWIVVLYAKTGIDIMSSAVLYRLGPELRFTNKKSIDLLKMDYIDPRLSIIDMIYSMIKHGMIQKHHSILPSALFKLKKHLIKFMVGKA